MSISSAFFSTLFSDLIYILCPLFFYIVLISSNNSITNKAKCLIFDLLLLSIVYIVSSYITTIYPIITFLLLNSTIIIAYLRNRVIIANILSLLLIILYYNSFNFMTFMIVPYVILNLFNIFKNKYNISDFIFIDLFLVIDYVFLIIWLLNSNYQVYKSLGLINMIFLVIFNYILIHIIYLLYNLGENIIKDNNKYKKIKQDSRIKTSLFKITHEIKNPIAVIKAYLDMMNVKNKKQVEKYIPIIKSEIDRLLNLLEDFLLVNKANISFDLMDINMLIEDIINRELPLMEANNIEFTSDLIDDEVYINGDYNRLAQVLINIIKNSIEAMEKKDKKTITIEEVIKDNNVNIIVSDSGNGISKKILSKIKEPFYTTKNRGTGLGVSLSDEIVKAHNGTLDYKSKEFIGTKVTIKLPIIGEDEI